MNISWGLIILGFILFWPAGLVLLILRIFGENAAPQQAKRSGTQQNAGRASVRSPAAQYTVPPQSAARSESVRTIPVPPQVAQEQSGARRESPLPPKSAVPAAARSAAQSAERLRPEPQVGTYAPVNPPASQGNRPAAGSRPSPSSKAQRRAPSSGGWTTMLVFGTLIAFAGFLSITIAACNALFSTGLTGNVLRIAIILFVSVSVPGIAMMILGGSMRGFAIRSKRYVRAIGENRRVSMDQLASVTGVSYAAVCKDVQRLMDRGFIRGGYIDREARALVFGNPFETVWEKPREKAAKTAARDMELTPDQRIRQINDQIQDEEISSKLERIEELTRSIFDYVDKRPDKIGRIKNFTGYYLPTTMKILEAYAQFEKQKVGGANISAAMQDIEEILDTLVKAFENQLDSLFMDEALDVSTDITVLENMLQREGLTDSGFKVG